MREDGSKHVQQQILTLSPESLHWIAELGASSLSAACHVRQAHRNRLDKPQPIMHG